MSKTATRAIQIHMMARIKRCKKIIAEFKRLGIKMQFATMKTSRRVNAGSKRVKRRGHGWTHRKILNVAKRVDAKAAADAKRAETVAKRDAAKAAEDATRADAVAEAAANRDAAKAAADPMWTNEYWDMTYPAMVDNEGDADSCNGI